MIWVAARAAIIRGVVTKKPIVVPRQTAAATLGEINIAKKISHMRTQSKGHRSDNHLRHNHRYNQTYMSVLTIIVEYYLSKSIKVKRFDTYKNCLLLARYQKVSAHSSTNKQAIAIQKQEWGSGGLVPPPLQVKNHRFLWKNIKNHHHPHVVVDCFFVYLLYILL